MDRKFPSILNSELAVQVLQQIARSNPGDYSTRIAEELDKPQSSISRVITELNEINFTKKGKRGKAQYYRIDYEGIADYWYRQIEKQLEQHSDKDSLEKLRENSEETKALSKRYTRKMLKNCSVAGEKTLQQVIFGDFLSSLSANALQNEDFFHKHGHLEPVSQGLVHLLQVEGHPEEFKECLQEEK